MQFSDVSIIGGGLVGGILAIALAKNGFKVTVIDRDPPRNLDDPSLDGRTTAVCYTSQQLFNSLGLWEMISPEAEPINTIKVFEGGSPWSGHFDHKDIGDHPMGYIVENSLLRQAIYKRAQTLGNNITWLAPAEVVTQKISQSGVHLYLKSGEEIISPIYVGAEGRGSATREAANIKTKHIDYQQKALVFSVYHDKPHENIAWEVFYPEGPMAFLPIKDCPTTGRHRSGVVWTLPSAAAESWILQSNEDIAAKLQELFGFLGGITLIGQKWCYPLTAQLVERYIAQRCVIMGDAAHVCHPVAGQGVNIGWRDAAVLCDVLVQARQLGLDLGSQVVLKRYQRRRRFDTLAIFAMTDTMVRLFSNNSSILYFLRNGGLGIVNRIPVLKKMFMKQAMGLGGDMPPLLRGRG